MKETDSLQIAIQEIQKSVEAYSTLADGFQVAMCKVSIEILNIWVKYLEETQPAIEKTVSQMNDIFSKTLAGITLNEGSICEPKQPE